MGLDFISDVIYGLKTEFGRQIIISKRIDQSVNQSTGQVTQSVVSIILPLAIPLPENQRLQFIRSFGNQQKQGGIDVKGRHYLIDKADLKDFVIDDINCFVTDNNLNYKIIALDDYELAMDLTAATMPTMQI